MAVPLQIMTNHEVAKTKIMTDQHMSEEYKQQLISALTVAELATNGISTDDKIQKIAEAIHGMLCSQSTMYNDIIKAVAELNVKQCKDCKAMKYVSDEEDKKLRDEQIQKMLEANGGNKQEADLKDSSWKELLKQLLMKPYIYMVLCVFAISPYGASIINAILAYFSAK